MMAESKEETPEKLELMLATLQPFTDQERDLAQQATNDFAKGKYDTAKHAMGKLGASRLYDPKVAHNRAVLDLCKSGYTTTDEFKKALLDICAKVQVNFDNISALDDVDHCVIFYNHAVLLYYLKQYRQAIVVMDKLFQFIEPMEETLARKVMFMLLDLYLVTYQPEKAMGMVAFIEKTLFSNSKAQSPEKDASKDGKEPSHSVDQLKPKFSQYKARLYIMLRSMKACKRELKNLVNTMGNTAAVVFLKSNFEYLRGNYRKALKVIATAPAPSRAPSVTGEHSPTMHYNNMAVIHFHLHKHHLGAFYMRKALQENENIIKETLAGVRSAQNLSGRPLPSYHVNEHHVLLYNMGIQLLHCSCPLPAFDCLIEVIQVYHVNPRLWLRLAECCIMAHRKNNEEDRALSKRLKVVQKSIGSGVHRKLILGTGIQDRNKSNDSPAMPMSTLEFASLCLSNALILLPSGTSTTKEASSSDDQSDAGKPSVDSLCVPAPPASPLRGTEIGQLRCSVLCASAYVALHLNNHLLALQYSKQLLQQPKLTGAHRYLGSLYKAEALVALDHIADAVAHLNPDTVNDVSVTLPETKQEEKGDKNGDKDSPEADDRGTVYTWSPSDIAQARAIMQYNLATAYSIRGEYEKASLTLTKSAQHMGSPLPAHMYCLKLYLELMEGRRKSAQAIIKDHFGHISPNRM